jgi:purine-binding chemotaxis protein CheW
MRRLLLESEEYAFDVEDIEEIVRYSDVTTIPDSPSYLLGLINLRGAMIPIVSLYSKLGLPDKTIDSDTKVLIVNVNGFEIGFVVDKITGIIDIVDENISDNKQESDIFPEIIILNNGARIILKMDIAGIIGEEEMQKLEAY